MKLSVLPCLIAVFVSLFAPSCLAALKHGIDSSNKHVYAVAYDTTFLSSIPLQFLSRISSAVSVSGEHTHLNSLSFESDTYFKPTSTDFSFSFLEDILFNQEDTGEHDFIPTEFLETEVIKQTHSSGVVADEANTTQTVIVKNLSQDTSLPLTHPEPEENPSHNSQVLLNTEDDPQEDPSYSITSQKTIQSKVFYPEYPDADYSVVGKSRGELEHDQDRDMYAWRSSQNSLQAFKISTILPLPDDFVSFADPALTYTYELDTNDDNYAHVRDSILTTRGEELSARASTTQNLNLFTRSFSLLNPAYDKEIALTFTLGANGGGEARLGPLELHYYLE